MVKSFEGLIGRRYPEHGVAITSANMKVFTADLFGTRTVRLLKQYHFGFDDPLFFPQPFDKRIPHLPCIRHPSNITDIEVIFWFLPSPDHWHPVAANQPGQGVGFIEIAFWQLLFGEFRKIEGRIKSAAQAPGSIGLLEDGKIKTYIARMKYLFGRLDLPATYEESVVAWRLTQ